MITCKGFRNDYDLEYDCDYEYSGEFGCEDCICNVEQLGGRFDPRTGKEYKPETIYQACYLFRLAVIDLFYNIIYELKIDILTDWLSKQLRKLL